MPPTAPLLVPTSLETERLLLRLPEEKDLPGMTAFVQDPLSMRFFGGVQGVEGSWRFLVGALGHWQLRGFGFYSVIDKESGAWIGRIGFIRPATWPALELAWGLLSPFWGKGYAPEAALAIRAHRPAGERLVSCIDPENLPSRRVAEKLGCVPAEETLLFHEYPARVWEHPPA